MTEAVTGELFAAVDADFRVVYASATSFDLAADELNGHMLSKLFPQGSEPDERQLWSALWRCMAERVPVLVTTRSGALERCIRAYPSKDGGLTVFARVRTLLARTPASQRSAPIGSGLKDLSTALATSIAHLPDGVFVWNDRGMQLANAAGLALLGYSHVDDMEADARELARALKVRDAQSGELIGEDELPFVGALNGAVCQRELVVAHRVRGDDRVLRVVASPIALADDLLGAITICSDISARTRAEADERRRADFEQQLIGIVSHDLRNPLQVIRFAAAVGAKAASDDARQLRHFERILSSSDRAMRMIDDLLDFSRIRGAGGFDLQRETVDLHELTVQLVSDVLSTFPGRNIALESSGDGHGLWDRDRLTQVLQNLVGNALQHTTEDTPVRVTTRGEPDLAVLEVHNGGPPIADEDLAQLFQPFHRGRGARSSGGRSMGLGLYITSHIVQAHGGTLRVVSNPEQGTTFTVCLPRQNAVGSN